ncbi:TetR/AcrR family transcriptional regulator [bacterium]|nr:TetR/AcrR family transcriptional regulator [bacterium]MBU1065274.1 TetR/AcrR family transcriptional regulator [bacterium]MBU1635843.1 TetR/AcrR family transcriptional regulator [bacterium]MBU1874798.1 TetR/AcrR family transcriptional regulator [bacterium]
MIQKTFPLAKKDLPVTFRPVIEHARTQIMKNGIRSFTIENLAAELRISKKTVYKYFASKEEFVEAVLMYNFDDLFSKVEKLPEEPDDPLEHIYQIIYIILNHLSVMNSNSIYEIKLYYPNIWNRIEQFRSGVLDDLISRFAKAQTLGLIRKDIKIDFLTGIILNVVQNVFQPEFFIKYPYSIPEMMKSFIDIVMNGIMEEGQRFNINSLDHKQP